MSRSSRGRMVLVVTLLLAVLVTAAVLSTSPREAQAASNCTYYSNAQHTTVVGQFGYDCCGNRVAWGVKTQYSVCGGCFICFPPPR